MGILGWIILGGLAGWIASALMHESQGCLTDVIVGIIGAVLGGLIFRLAGAQPLTGGLDLWSLMVATIGSIVLIAFARALRGSAKS